MITTNLPILLLLLTVTQVPLLVYALVVQKANRALLRNWTQLVAGSLQLPLPVTQSDAKSEPKPMPTPPKPVHRYQIQVPVGAIPRSAFASPKQGDK